MLYLMLPGALLSGFQGFWSGHLHSPLLTRLRIRLFLTLLFHIYSLLTLRSGTVQSPLLLLRCPLLFALLRMPSGRLLLLTHLSGRFLRLSLLQLSIYLIPVFLRSGHSGQGGFSGPYPRKVYYFPSMSGY